MMPSINHQVQTLRPQRARSRVRRNNTKPALLRSQGLLLAVSDRRIPASTIPHDRGEWEQESALLQLCTSAGSVEFEHVAWGKEVS